MRRLLFLLLVGSGFAAAAAAAPARYALVVGHNQGGVGLAPLRYAESDARNVARVLSELGQFPTSHISVILGKNAAEVDAALDRLEEQLRRDGEAELVMFYYSGHATQDYLRMGDSLLRLEALKQRLEKLPARVRLGFFDACQSGGILRPKGATLTAPIQIEWPDDQATQGTAFITSSTARQNSYESDELGGSFFSYYVASGLRGDADTSRDGRVSLAELYPYVYQRTRQRTLGLAEGAQTPAYDFDLRGQGEVMLSDLHQAASYLVLPAEEGAEYYIYDRTASYIVAETRAAADGEKRIALPEGSFLVKKREKESLAEKRFAMRKGMDQLADMSGARRYPYSVEKVKRGEAQLADDPNQVALHYVLRALPYHGWIGGAALSYDRHFRWGSLRPQFAVFSGDDIAGYSEVKGFGGGVALLRQYRIRGSALQSRYYWLGIELGPALDFTSFTYHVHQVSDGAFSMTLGGQLGLDVPLTNRLHLVGAYKIGAEFILDDCHLKPSEEGLATGPLPGSGSVIPTPNLTPPAADRLVMQGLFGLAVSF